MKIKRWLPDLIHYTKGGGYLKKYNEEGVFLKKIYYNLRGIF